MDTTNYNRSMELLRSIGIEYKYELELNDKDLSLTPQHDFSDEELLEIADYLESETFVEYTHYD